MFKAKFLKHREKSLIATWCEFHIYPTHEFILQLHIHIFSIDICCRYVFFSLFLSIEATLNSWRHEKIFFHFSVTVPNTMRNDWWMVHMHSIAILIMVWFSLLMLFLGYSSNPWIKFLIIFCDELEKNFLRISRDQITFIHMQHEMNGEAFPWNY